MPSRVLVTGHRGLVGPYVVAELDRQGHAAVGFDLQDGDDVRSPSSVAAALKGCEAVIHLAAADDPLPAEVIVDTNVVGAMSVLDEAVRAGCERVVIASSVDALGIFMSEAPPDYLPLDDAHPARPGTPYGAAKRAVELTAERTAASTGLEVICLRPPGVCDDATMAMIRALVHPTVPWRGGTDYDAAPRRSLINASVATELLGWSPEILWTDRA